MKSIDLIESLKQDTRDIITYCNTHIAHLPLEQLMARPEPSKWSILECMEHMNISSGHYIKRLSSNIPKAIAKNQPHSKEFIPGRLGDKFSKGMLPDSDGNLTNGMKTFFFFEPKNVSKKQRKAYDEFLDMQQQTLELLEAAKKIDLNKNKVVSTLGPILIFKAGDAFRFAIAHNIRHMLQIKNLLAKKELG